MALVEANGFEVSLSGIQQAMAKIYKLDLADKKATREKMLKISARWAPYRTYACFYLWKYKDADPVKSKNSKNQNESQ